MANTVTMTKDGHEKVVSKRSFERVWKQRGWKLKQNPRSAPAPTVEAPKSESNDQSVAE